MAQPALNCPVVVARVGESVAAGVTKHMRVRFELQAGAGSGAVDHPGETGRGEGRGRALALESAQRSQLITLDRVGALSIPVPRCRAGRWRGP
jgi:hypothetical protein